jgi:hypothetical protein
MKAIDCMMNITNFDDSKYNTEFKNELAVLNKLNFNLIYLKF